MNNRPKVRRQLNYILKSRVHRAICLTYDEEHQVQEPPCRIYRTTDERIRLLWYLCRAGFRYNDKCTEKGANNVKFCEKLKKIREEKGMTQVELANLTGLGQTTISNLEHYEHRKVSADTVVKIARALNVPVKQLMDS